MIPKIPSLTQIIGGIAGVAIVGMAIALWFQGNRIDGLTAERDGLRDWRRGIVETTSFAAGTKDQRGRPALLAVDEVAPQIAALGLAVSDLRNSLAVKNAESEMRAADLERQRASAEADRLRFARERSSTDASIERLRALAQRPASGQCRASPELLRELEGL
jgi:hypothetical protein